MLDPTEAGLLWAIAQDHAENTPRLAYADWLDENEDAPRAAFIRVQCELASGVSDERRAELRQRERDLLNEHWREWVAAFGLDIEDVAFERGLIDKVRLVKWDARLLDLVSSPRFATLTELDLSGLVLGDVGVYAIARGQLPAIRKLILSDNHITNSGITSLKSATGFPRLDTLYLAGNAIEPFAAVWLEGCHNFKLKTIDLGVPAEGYSMSPGQTDVARRAFIRTQLLPVVTKYFEQYPVLQSAAMCLAQFWDDNANDAVHAELIVSELPEPMLKFEQYVDPDPNVPNLVVLPETGLEQSSSTISLWNTNIPWDENSGAIPLWAAFAPEGGNQNNDLRENYLPAVLFHRYGGYEILPMTRPHLDGIRPEWEAGG